MIIILIIKSVDTNKRSRLKWKLTDSGISVNVDLHDSTYMLIG